MGSKFIAALCGLLLLSAVTNADSLVGKNAPDITIRKWMTADPPDIDKMAGSVYIVEFWAMWCSPCVRNIPHLIELNNKYKDKGVQFIALSQDKSEEELRTFLRNKKINYHVAIDNGTTDSFKIKCYPTIFVVDHKGLILWRGMPSNLDFEKAIKKAVAAAPKRSS